MSKSGAASLAALSPARAEASRRNGAKSRGPKTPEGKARSALNALKHGLCAGKAVVLGDEDWDMFDALEAALMAELAPQSPMQAVLARRIVLATWRLERVERMEAELLAQNMRDTASFGLGMIRDCNGPRAFNTLLRYRGTALAEFWRCLRTLEALQAKVAAQAPHQEAAKEAAQAQPTRAQGEAAREAAQALVRAEAAPGAQPNQPEARGHRGDSRAPASAETWPAPDAVTSPAPDPTTALPGIAPSPAAPAPDRRAAAPRGSNDLSSEQPIKPERRANPGAFAIVIDPPQTAIDQLLRPACRGVDLTMRP